MLNAEKYKYEIIEEYQNLLKKNIIDGDGNRMNKAIKTIAYKHRRKQLHGASGTFKWLCEEYEESISLSKLEFEILKWLEKGGYKFIFRNPNDNLMAHNNAPKKTFNGWAHENSSNDWVSENQYKTLLSFNELFKFIKWEDEKPTSIDELLKNCEVVENV